MLLLITRRELVELIVQWPRLLEIKPILWQNRFNSIHSKRTLGKIDFTLNLLQGRVLILAFSKGSRKMSPEE
jgi:hypothetical protein